MMALDNRETRRQVVTTKAKQRSNSESASRRLSGHAGPPPEYPSGGGDSDPEPFNEACSLVWVNLTAYLDDELDQDTYQVVDNHIAYCARCSAMLSSLQETDRLIEREWREYPPLPSSSERKLAIDNIMAELPSAVEAPPEYAPKRVHQKVRWMRFSTGFMGLIALFSLL
jgi:anti-sigma factor RsiW